MVIPIDLTKVSEPLPQGVYDLMCEKVVLYDGEGNKTEDEGSAEVVSLRVRVLTDDPTLADYKKSIQQRLNLPVPADSGDIKDTKMYFIKQSCEGFGVEFDESGFSPFDFAQKTATAMIVQNAAKDGSGQIYNNIKKFI